MLSEDDVLRGMEAELMTEDSVITNIQDLANGVNDCKLTPGSLQKILGKIALRADDDARNILFAAAELTLTGKTLKDLVAKARSKAKNYWSDRRKREPVYYAPNPQSEELVSKLSDEIGKTFDPPPLYRTQFHLAAMEKGVIWLCGPVEKGVGEAYCTPFIVQGEAHYQEDGSRAIRLRIRSGPGEWKDVDIKAAWLAHTSGTEAITALMDAGFKHRPKGRDYILEHLCSVEMPAIQVADRPGWHGDTFLLPTGGAIPPNTGLELSSKVQVKGTAQQGSFDAWQKDVTWLFKLEKGIYFQNAFLIGYAGNLAALLNDKPLGFFFYGPSSRGKSEGEASAVSQFGNGNLGDGLFISGKHTDNSVEVPCVAMSGSVVAFDEAKYLDPKTLQDIFFMVESGMGKGRLYRDGRGHKTRRWRGGAFILSDEMTMSERLAAAKIRKAAGLSVRMASIDYHDSHIFPDKVFKRIEGMKNNFGFGGPAFVEALGRLGYVADPGKLRDRKDKIASELSKGKVGDHAMRLRAARIPAYIQLAAEVHIEAGLLPKDYDAGMIGKWVWNQMLASDTAPEIASVKGLDALKSALVGRKGMDVIDYNPPDSRYGQTDRKSHPAVAYYNANHKDHKDRTLYVILADKLTELSGGSATRTAMLDILAKEKMLVLDSKGARTWGFFPKLAKVQYVVVDASGIEAAEESNAAPVSKDKY